MILGNSAPNIPPKMLSIQQMDYILYSARYAEPREFCCRNQLIFILNQQALWVSFYCEYVIGKIE
jgi:hypothetical protein